MKSPDRRPHRKVARAYAGAGVAAGLVILSVAQGGSAQAARPGADNQTASGTIKIHSPGTTEDDNRNEPKVCAFTLVGDNFDSGESLTYEIALAPPFKGALALAGRATADSTGSWSTETIKLDPGHYKVEVHDGEDDKFKVVKVECDPATPGDEGPGDEDPTDEGPGDEDPTDEGPGDEDPTDEGPGDEDPTDEGPGDQDPQDEDPPLDPSGDPAGNPAGDPSGDPSGNPAGDPAGDPAGNPAGDPAGNPAGGPVAPGVETQVLPVTPEQEEVADVDLGNMPIDGTVVEDGEVTGTWESHDVAELPHTGASAGLGVAGLLLVGAGLGLRRAGRDRD